MALLKIWNSTADTSSVIIREGTTSDSPIVKEYNWPSELTATDNPLATERPFQSFVTTLSSGFYIAFKGTFSQESRFAIVYTIFSFMGDVYFGFEFLFSRLSVIDVNEMNFK